MTTATEALGVRGVYHLDPSRTRIAIDMIATGGVARTGMYEHMSGSLRVVETKPWSAHFVGLVDPGEFRDDLEHVESGPFSTVRCLPVTAPIQMVFRLSSTAIGDIDVRGQITTKGLTQPVRLIAKIIEAKRSTEGFSNSPRLNVKGRLLWPCPGDGQLEGTLGRDVIALNVDVAFKEGSPPTDDDERRIDEALDESFPASDPPAYTGSAWKRRAKD